LLLATIAASLASALLPAGGSDAPPAQRFSTFAIDHAVGRVSSIHATIA
jgi:hypothetical protein